MSNAALTSEFHAVYTDVKLARRFLSLPAEHLPHLPGGSLPHADQGRLRGARRRRGDLPSRAARAARDQAPARRSHLRAAVAGEAEAGNGAPDAGAPRRAARLRRLRGDRIDRPLRERAAQAPRVPGSARSGERPRPDLVAGGHRRARPAREARRLGAALRLCADPRDGRGGRERGPRDLLHRAPPRSPGQAGALRALDRAHAAPGRRVHPARPRRHDAADGQVRLPRAHRVQRRAQRARGRKT